MLKESDLLWLERAKATGTVNVIINGHVDQVTDWIGGLLALAKEGLAARGWLKADDSFFATLDNATYHPSLGDEEYDASEAAKQAFRQLVSAHDAEQEGVSDDG